jgi:two-component system, chemotaxis family, sensor kinase CheA
VSLPKYAELFRTESLEHVATVNRLLLVLDTDAGNAGAVEGLFRAVHTLKGMAAAMEYGAVAELAHVMESVLEGLRSGARAAEPGLLDALFRGADALEAGVAACPMSVPPPLLASAAAELQAAAADGNAATLAPGTLTPYVTEPHVTEVDGGESAVVTHRLWVRAVVSADAALPGVRAFMLLRRARDLGRIGDLAPPEPELLLPTFRGELGFRLTTGSAADTVREQLLCVGELATLEVAEEESAASGSDAAPAAVPEPAEAVEMPTAVHRRRPVRVDADRLDAVMGRVGELVVLRDRLVSAAASRSERGTTEPAGAAARLINELRDEVLRMRLVPVREVFDRFPRLVRDAAQRLRKKVDFGVDGDGLEIDRALLDRIGDPIVHLLRNAVDHGIELPEERLARGKPEQGRIRLSARRERDWIVVRVADDGRGIDRERVVRKAVEMGLVSGAAERVTDAAISELIMRAGLSTSERVTELSGRGVGLDAAATEVRALGGSLDFATDSGTGTTFTLRFPSSVGLIRALLVACGGHRYLVPVSCIAETTEIRPSDLVECGGGRTMIHRGETVPLIALGAMLAGATEVPPPPRQWLPIVFAEVDAQRIAVQVDASLGHQEVVTQRFATSRGTLPVFQGAGILPDGEPALILDMAALVRHAHAQSKDTLIHVA